MRCCTLLLTIAALAAADAAPPGEIRLDAKPLRVQLVTDLQFGHGQVRVQQSRLEITISGKLPLANGTQFIEIGKVSLIEAVSDTGAHLEANPEESPSLNGDDNGVTATVSLQSPGSGIHSLQRLVIAADVTTAEQGTRRAVIRPVKDWIAKRLRIDGYADADIELEDLAAETLTLGMSASMAQCLEMVHFRTAAGAELQGQESNTSNEGDGWQVRHYPIALPADGQIELDLKQGVAKHHLILTATAIALTATEGELKPAAVLPTVPVPKEGEAQPEPPVPALLKPIEDKPAKF